MQAVAGVYYGEVSSSDGTMYEQVYRSYEANGLWQYRDQTCPTDNQGYLPCSQNQGAGQWAAYNLADGSIFLMMRATGQAQVAPDTPRYWWVPVCITAFCWVAAGYLVVAAYSSGGSIPLVGATISSVPIASCIIYMVWEQQLLTKDDLLGVAIIVGGAVVMRYAPLKQWFG